MSHAAAPLKPLTFDGKDESMKHTGRGAWSEAPLAAADAAGSHMCVLTGVGEASVSEGGGGFEGRVAAGGGRAVVRAAAAFASASPLSQCLSNLWRKACTCVPR